MVLLPKTITNPTIFSIGIILLLAFPSCTNSARCLENGRFYRDPDRPTHKIWSGHECAKYFLCLEGEVFEFRCSVGLLFDVNRQICDFKLNVDNCDVTAEAKVPRPLLEEAECSDYDLGCADGTCLPQEYFCDGSVDCPDASDEGYCDLYDDPNAATPCNTTTCKLPECFCSNDGIRIPGNLDASQTPQMILLTFDDAINFDNFDLYNNLLFNGNNTNPNGCPISATFYVSHQYNNYQQTQKLWNDGHEIAVHSITHRGPEDWWSQNATIEDYFDEMVGQANILNKYASIRLQDIRGLRVPFLKVGWNRQFLMMKEFGFVYDSSIVAPYNDPPIWPYTLDHRIPHECSNLGTKQNCPTRAYRGIWEMVINQLITNEYTCSMVDSCPPTLNGEDVYKMFMHNFKRHYLTNRAPYGLYFHSTWFKKTEYLNAFQRFLKEMLLQPDVWFVTKSQAINWMKTPISVNKLNDFDAWDCRKQFQDSELACLVPNVCKLHSRVFQQERVFHTCNACPPKYPWIRNEFGLD